jgi:hypothetical protein
MRFSAFLIVCLLCLSPRLHAACPQNEFAWATQGQWAMHFIRVVIARASVIAYRLPLHKVGKLLVGAGTIIGLTLTLLLDLAWFDTQSDPSEVLLRDLASFAGWVGMGLAD